jgi:Ca2+-binding EF-hand superfamily protein
MRNVTVNGVTKEEKMPLQIELYEAIILFSMYFGYVIFMAHNQAARMWVLRVIVRDPNYANVGDVKENVRSNSVTNPVARDSEDQAVAETGAGGAIVLVANKTYSDDGGARALSSPAEKKMARASIGLNVNYPRASNFRAGMLRIMLSEKSLLDRTGFSAVSSVQGDVNATFSQIAYKKQGFIDKQELKKFLEDKAGVKELDTHALNEVFEAIDRDQDGKISEVEFAKWYHSADQALRMDIVEKFKKYDANGDGKIDANELGSLLSDLGVQEVTDAVIQGFIADLDTNKDGAIQEDEFVHWYQKQPFFASDKPVECEEEVHEPMDPFEIPNHLRGQIFWAISLPLVLTMHYTVVSAEHALYCGEC